MNPLPTPNPNEQGTPIFQALLLRLLELAILGGLSYAAVAASAQPALAYIAGAGGGLYASKLFALVRDSAKLRAWVDARYPGPGLGGLAAGAVAWAFFSTATSAATVAVMGLIISSLAVGTMSYFTTGTLSDATAAFVAFMASQAVYAVNHPRPAPDTNLPVQ